MAFLGAVKRTILNCLPTSWAGCLRAWRMHWSIRRYRPHVVRHRYGPGELSVYLADGLGQGWYDHDWEELPEIAELRQSRLRPGCRIFDLGAHQGVVALMLAREAGPTGSVLGVEANPHNATVARKNAELNGMSQIEILQAAVSNRAGTLEFNTGLNGQIDDGTGAWGRIQVPAVTLDELGARYGMPDVVFLDIEGAECLALQGAAQVLDAGPDLFVEVHVGCGLEKLGGSVAQVLAFFPESRFALLARAEDDKAFRPLTADDPLLSDRFFLLARPRPF